MFRSTGRLFALLVFPFAPLGVGLAEEPTSDVPDPEVTETEVVEATATDAGESEGNEAAEPAAIERRISPPVRVVPNNLTPEEILQGFELLFDGRSFDGWRNPGNWTIDGDALFRETEGGGLTLAGKSLADDFELRFEWRVARGSRSGVMYRPGLYMYQVVDDDRHPDGRNPRTAAGSLYFCMPPSKSAGRPAGRWNTGRIVCQRNVLQHWLNGEKVVDFDYSEPRWRDHVELLQRRGTNLSARGTRIHLQDHGDPVWYRSIRYRELLPTDEVDHETVTPAKIPEAVLEREREALERVDELRTRGRAQH